MQNNGVNELLLRVIKDREFITWSGYSHYGTTIHKIMSQLHINSIHSDKRHSSFLNSDNSKQRLSL